MLRRFVPFSRMLAVATVGLALGACSKAAEDATAPSTSEAELGAPNPLHFWKSATNVFFDATGGVTPPPQVVEVGGLVVTTTPYVRVLGINYSPSNVKDWLRITQRPGLVSDGNLGVRLTFTIRQVPGLDIGAVATVPITVPGARNGPQTITVYTNRLNCPVQNSIPYPTPQGAMSYVNGQVDSGDCSSPLFTYGSEWKKFDLYTITIPGSRNFRVDMRGSATGGGTLSDPYIYVYDPVIGNYVTRDDDSGDGLDARLSWTNPSSSDKVYYIIASQFATGQYGTYRLEVTDNGIPTSPVYTVAAEPPTAQELAKLRNHKESPR